MREALDDALGVYDVEIENGASVQNIHKVKDGRHLWYFANLGTTAADTWVRLRGNFTPQLWNPETGAVNAAPDFTNIVENGHAVTRVKLTLASNKSIFVVAPRANPSKANLDLAATDENFLLNANGLTSDSRYTVEDSIDLLSWDVFRDFVADPSTDSSGISAASFTGPKIPTAQFFRLKQEE
jgi:hypothetical protein